MAEKGKTVEGRKTFIEWEQIYGLATLNVEKQDITAPDGAPVLMTCIEFEERIKAYMARRRPTDWVLGWVDENGVNPVDKAPFSRGTSTGNWSQHGGNAWEDEATAGWSEGETATWPGFDNVNEPLDDDATAFIPRTARMRATRRKIPLRRLGWPVILVTLPTLATVLLDWLVRIVERFAHLRWFVSATVLLADLIILLVLPIPVLLSGPGYLWYQLLNYIYLVVTRGWSVGQHALLNKSLNLTGEHPLFWSVHLGGSPLSLYFGLPQAIVSSLFWATTLVFGWTLLREVRQRPAERRERSNSFSQ